MIVIPYPTHRGNKTMAGYSGNEGDNVIFGENFVSSDRQGTRNDVIDPTKPVFSTPAASASSLSSHGSIDSDFFASIDLGENPYMQAQELLRLFYIPYDIPEGSSKAFPSGAFILQNIPYESINGFSLSLAQGTLDADLNVGSNAGVFEFHKQLLLLEIAEWGGMETKLKTQVEQIEALQFGVHGAITLFENLRLDCYEAFVDDFTNDKQFIYATLTGALPTAKAAALATAKAAVAVKVAVKVVKEERGKRHPKEKESRIITILISDMRRRKERTKKTQLILMILLM